MKRQVTILDAVPSKRLFLSIIADYDLNKSVCELIDNGFDVWTRNGRRGPISIDVVIDYFNRTIRIEDNAGGLARDELRYIVGPGQTGSREEDETIGIFGVGTKRAVVALAEQIRITTRHRDMQTYQIEFDDGWLNDDDWSLPLFEVSEIEPGTTRIDLQRLREPIGEDHEEKLRKHLAATYAKFIDQAGVTLKLNGTEIRSRNFNNWSYPPDYLPRRYHGKLITPKGSEVEVEVLAGLSNESSPTSGEYGVYFYCNDRLVAPAMKTFDVGFSKGQAGLPHPKIALTKVIVSLRGDAAEMPWNSSKSDVSTKHHVFVALHDWLVTVVKDYAAVSRAWEGRWSEKVFAYPTGDIIDTEILDFISAKRSFLPAPPKSKPRIAERVASKNEKITREKPWIAGLYEGVVAAKEVAKQPFTQGNWFAFNLLNLTLITAFKSYIVHEQDDEDSELNLRELLLDSKLEGLKRRIPLDDDIWIKLQNFMSRQRDLLYGRATPTITSMELNEAQSLVDRVLKNLFEIETEA
ncbi:ATP-binding protein [Thalassospira sp. SN3W]|uniref:ATP-binding protein n=1 Tax=Thalassospira sp. SN3W TaxID=3035476 RepID=UPI00311B4324